MFELYDYSRFKYNSQYFSAISNEVNLKGLQHGWLVFGVRNKNKEIVGSDYRNTKGLDTLKQEISVGQLEEFPLSKYMRCIQKLEAKRRG